MTRFLRLIACIIALAAIAGLAAFAIGSRPGQPQHYVTTCSFDGGGSAVSGSVSRTSDGRTWLCTDNGTIIPWPGKAS